jgi:peptidoglycan glycosyltransferase
MDRQIRRLALAMGVLFLVLFAQLNYLQVFASRRLVAHPGNEQRRIIQEYRVDRGEIFARDRRTRLAQSRATEGKFKFLRVYPRPELYGHVTGFYSLIFGATRLEDSYGDFLSAQAPELIRTTLEDDILNRPRRGADVFATIDPDLQELAFDELQRAVGAASEQGGGAVAAMDPTTGEVLALVSVPPYDANELSSHDPESIREAMRDLRPNDPDSPLISNATDQIFAPGSTFKIIDLAAALEAGLTASNRFDNPRELDLPQTVETLENFGGTHCAGGADQITLEQGFIESCNVTFGQVGLRLGPERLFAQSRAFGFASDVDFDIPFAEGRFPEPEFFVDRQPAVAFSAIGQQDVAANPLQMAMVASAIANGGVMLQPHLVRDIRDATGRPVRTFDPEAIGRPISPGTAAEVTRMMTLVVEEGTGSAARIPGIEVAGKTGTAQTATGDPHAWFVGFAPADDPRIAVAVVVLNGGDLGSEATGGQVAAPVARAVMQAALDLDVDEGAG